MLWVPCGLTFFVFLPSKGTSGGFPHVAEFTAVLLLLKSNLSQIILSLNDVILSSGLQIALCLITRSLPTFLSSSYPIVLLVHFVIARHTTRNSWNAWRACAFTGVWVQGLRWGLCGEFKQWGKNQEITIVQVVSFKIWGWVFVNTERFLFHAEGTIGHLLISWILPAHCAKLWTWSDVGHIEVS